MKQIAGLLGDELGFNKEQHPQPMKFYRNHKQAQQQ
jgi:hypothetical protein